MNSAVFDELQEALANDGAEATIEKLCRRLRETKDYGSLFYALLLKKRHELGVSPVPTEAAQALPEAVHAAYEDSIREAARLVGGLFLEDGNIPRAWVYFRMIGEPDPVAQAMERHQIKEDEDCQQLIEIAYHQGVHPRKGFDWIVERFGICSAITMVSGQEFPQADVREYCIKGLVRTLYEQLRVRLVEEITRHDGKPPVAQTVRELVTGNDWLFDEESYHIDVSHLGAVVQMSIHLPPSKELELARELCLYGQRLSSRFQYAGEAPFEDQYRDYGVYLSVLAGEDVEEGIAHFQRKIDNADPERAGTLPAEALVNLLVRVNRPAQALAVARRHLVGAENQRLSCPGISELCQRTNDYRTLAEVARELGDPVHFVAGLLAAQRTA
jgi:hypothetical protein